MAALDLAGLAGITASLVGAALCARARLRRSTGEERVQMLWFTWAALAIPLGLVVCWLDYWITGTAGTLTMLGVTVGGSVLPFAIGIGILRYRLFDIELVLSRTLTYGLLTVLVITTYAAVLTGLGAVVDDTSTAGLVAVGVIAVAIQPVHARVRRRAERWVYGDRADPYAALRRLSDRLQESLDPAEVVQTVTASVAEALRVNNVAVELDRGQGKETAASHGVRGRGSIVRLPLAYQGERLGELAVEVPPGRQLTAPDRRMLDDLARHAGVVVNAVNLTLDLRRSRARLVTAQEEERRRLRRDLHDGLGPSLAAIVLKLNAVSAMVRDPAPSQVLAELREETKAAVAEIRWLVDDMRPPALDEVGLVAALRQKAARLSRPGGREDGETPLIVDVDVPSGAPPLPAAVEVAAYRIATEALTNVVRHSRASPCVVTVTMTGALEVTVADNGTGPGNATGRGVGWTSMRERAAELGGSCTITRCPEGGTLVRAVLPLPEPHDAAPPTVPPPTRAGRPLMSGSLRVLVADDHPAFRAGLRMMLSSADDVELVAEAETGTQAVELAEQTRPDVVVMDLRMPGLDGIEATPQLLSADPEVGVVVLTMYEDDDSVFAAMRAGAGLPAQGRRAGRDPPGDPRHRRRGAIFGPTVARRVIEHLATGSGSARAAFPTLTDREREILELIATGKGNAAIAHDLVLTLKTVRNHVSNIFGKLQVSDRAAAIVKARDAGFGAAPKRL